MRARSVLRAAVFLSLLPAVLPAQSVGKMIENDFRNFGGDVWAVWTSPFRATPKDWLTTGIVIAGSAAFMPLDDDVDRIMERNRTSSGWKVIEPLREGGALYTGKYLTPVAGAAFIYALATKNTKVQEGIFGCIASYTAGSVVRNYVFYNLVARDRPELRSETGPVEAKDQYQISFPGESDWNKHSLPAGHAANIMSCATFLNTRFEMGLVEPVLYAMTAGTAVGRLVDRRHWTSDTFLGLAYGYAIGSQVANRSLKRAEKAIGMTGGASSVLSKSYLQPSREGITIGWRTTF
jgi:membrane-associated phospholipid phosphatase